MTRPLPALFLPLMIALLGAGPAQAETIPFTYFAVPGYGPGVGYHDVQMSVDNIHSALDPVVFGGAVPVRLPLLDVNNLVTAPVGSVNIHGDVLIELHIQERDRWLADEHLLSGAFKGTLTGRHGSTVTLNFPSEPMLFRLDNHLYSVRLESTPIGAWDSPTTRVYMDVTIQNVPEPTTLALGAAAALCFGVRRHWWKRNAKP